MNISSMLSKHIEKIVVEGKSELYTAPEIKEKKLNNAIKAMGVNGQPSDVRAIIDTSLMHNAKAGILFTNKAIYFHEALEQPEYFEYKDIEDATYTEEVKLQKDKQKTIPHVDIKFKDEADTYSVSNAIIEWLNAHALADLLKDIGNAQSGIQDEEDSTKSVTIYSLEDLPAKVKLEYTQLLCNFALHDDSQIDANEYRSIISFAMRINLPREEQIALNSYLTGDNLIDSSQLLDELENSVSEETVEILSKSLMKDLLSIINQKKNQSIEDWQSNAYLCDLAESLNLSKEQVNVLVESIQHDQLILDKRLNDTQMQKQTKDLIARATSVGVPLTALYFTGSIGVSAAGITSSLAALGFGGVLGFSSMVTGIGVLILAGTATYKGVEHFTGRKDVENNKRREALLQQIIRNTQKTLNYLIENVNEVSSQLIEATQNEYENELKIQKLTKLMALLSKGAQATTTQLDHYQSESILTSVPRKLDVEKVAQLTKEPTLKKYYDIVLANYEKNEEGQYWLKSSITSDDAATLNAILDEIGYFTIKGVAKSGFGSATSTIKGIFN